MEEKKAEKKEEKPKKIAIVRVRGLVNLKKSIKDTLNMLRLYRKNYCVVYNATPSILGMVNKVKYYVTWGEINQETLNLLEKRREKTKDKKGKEITKLFFRLSPPRKGFGRKGIKMPFSLSGALGDRKEKINDLIKRMV